MEKIDLRPRHSMDVPITVEESINRIKKGVELSDGFIDIKVNHNHLKLTISSENQHYWSPELNIDVDANDDGTGSIVHGVCGPKQTVWLMFTFFYGLLFFILMIVAIYGFSRMNLGLSSEILYFTPILILIIVGMFLTSKYGQKLAYDQMYQLRKTVKRAIKDNNRDLKNDS